MIQLATVRRAVDAEFALWRHAIEHIPVLHGEPPCIAPGGVVRYGSTPTTLQWFESISALSQPSIKKSVGSVVERMLGPDVVALVFPPPAGISGSSSRLENAPCRVDCQRGAGGEYLVRIDWMFLRREVTNAETAARV